MDLAEMILKCSQGLPSLPFPPDRQRAQKLLGCPTASPTTTGTSTQEEMFCVLLIVVRRSAPAVGTGGHVLRLVAESGDAEMVVVVQAKNRDDRGLSGGGLKDACYTVRIIFLADLVEYDLGMGLVNFKCGKL